MENVNNIFYLYSFAIDKSKTLVEFLMNIKRNA